MHAHAHSRAQTVSFKYLADEQAVLEIGDFVLFGTVTSGITEYVKVVWYGGVTARYVLYHFEVRALDMPPWICLQDCVGLSVTTPTVSSFSSSL
jgi:hypothetical protein